MVITTEVPGNVVMDVNSNAIVVQILRGPEIINQKAPGGHALITMKRQGKNMRGSSISISDLSNFFLVFSHENSIACGLSLSVPTS